jgi:hypothetical protein
MWHAFGNSDSKARLKSVHACDQWRVYELRPSPDLVCFPGKTSSSTAPSAFFASADRRCIAPSAMEITRVKIRLSDDERIKAYATITIDDCFVIQALDSHTAKKKAIFFLCREKRRLTVHTNQEVETHALRLCKPSTASTTKNHNLLSWFAIDSERDSIV